MRVYLSPQISSKEIKYSFYQKIIKADFLNGECIFFDLSEVRVNIIRKERKDSK